MEVVETVLYDAFKLCLPSLSQVTNKMNKFQYYMRDPNAIHRIVPHDISILKTVFLSLIGG